MSGPLTQAPAVVCFLIVQRVDVGCCEQELVVWEALARRDSANILGLYWFFRINRLGGAMGPSARLSFMHLAAPVLEENLAVV